MKMRKWKPANAVTNFMKQIFILLFSILLFSRAFAIGNYISFGDTLEEAIELIPEEEVRTIRREITRTANWSYNIANGKVFAAVAIGEKTGVNRSALLSFDISKFLENSFQGNINLLRIPENTSHLVPFEKEGELQAFAIGEDFLYIARKSGLLEISKISEIEIPKRKFSVDFPIDLMSSENFYTAVIGGNSITRNIIDRDGQLFDKDICKDSADFYYYPKVIRPSKKSSDTFVVANVFNKDMYQFTHSTILRIDESCNDLFNFKEQMIGGAIMDEISNTMFLALFSTTAKEEIAMKIVSIDISKKEMKEVFSLLKKCDENSAYIFPRAPWLLSVDKDYISVTSLLVPTYSGRVNRSTNEWEPVSLDRNTIINAVYSFYYSGKFISILNEDDKKNPLGKFSVSIYDFDADKKRSIPSNGVGKIVNSAVDKTSVPVKESTKSAADTVKKTVDEKLKDNDK